MPAPRTSPLGTAAGSSRTSGVEQGGGQEAHTRPGSNGQPQDGDQPQG